MDVIKSILFQLLDSDTSLGNIPSLSECHNEDLDQSLYGICFSSKEGSNIDRFCAVPAYSQPF